MLTGRSEDPKTLASDGMRMILGYFLETGQTEITGRHEDGGVIAARFRPGRSNF